MLHSMRSERAADLDRLLQDLEQRLMRLSRIAPRATPGTVDRVSDVVVSALSDMADRFRGRTRAMGGEASEFGDQALRIGNDALRKLTREVEHRPLLLLALAVGVGALAVGILSRR